MALVVNMYGWFVVGRGRVDEADTVAARFEVQDSCQLNDSKNIHWKSAWNCRGDEWQNRQEWRCGTREIGHKAASIHE